MEDERSHEGISHKVLAFKVVSHRYNAWMSKELTKSYDIETGDAAFMAITDSDEGGYR